VDDTLYTFCFCNRRLLFCDRFLKIPAYVGSAVVARVARERLMIENPDLARYLIGVHDDVHGRNQHALVVEEIDIRRSHSLRHERGGSVGRHDDVDDVRVRDVDGAKWTRNADRVRKPLSEADHLRRLWNDGDRCKLVRAPCANACHEERPEEARPRALLVVTLAHEFLPGACLAFTLSTTELTKLPQLDHFAICGSRPNMRP
jgi:hypothetical protein